jgi:hypothetical protein
LQRLPQIAARVVEAPQFDLGHAQREQAVLLPSGVRSRQREAALQDLAASAYWRDVGHHTDIVEQQRLLVDVAKDSCRSSACAGSSACVVAGARAQPPAH